MGKLLPRKETNNDILHVPAMLPHPAKVAAYLSWLYPCPFPLASTPPPRNHRTCLKFSGEWSAPKITHIMFVYDCWGFNKILVLWHGRMGVQFQIMSGFCFSGTPKVSFPPFFPQELCPKEVLYKTVWALEKTPTTTSRRIGKSPPHEWRSMQQPRATSKVCNPLAKTSPVKLFPKSDPPEYSPNPKNKKHPETLRLMIHCWWVQPLWKY